MNTGRPPVPNLRVVTSAGCRLDVKVTANWEADFADAQQPGFRAVSRINRLAVYSISDSK